MDKERWSNGTHYRSNGVLDVVVLYDMWYLNSGSLMSETAMIGFRIAIGWS